MNQYIVCCGMSRSGGTAQYQMVNELVERHRGGKAGGFGIHYLPEHRPNQWITVKVERAAQQWIRAVRDGRGIALGIYRDPRDVAASLMEFRKNQAALGYAKHRDGSFGDVLEDICDAMEWWKAWEKLVTYAIAYETASKNWPAAVVSMAMALGIKIDGAEAIDIATNWCVQRNEERCAGMDVWMGGKRTMLTRGHIGKNRGMIGRWQHELLDEQVRLVEQIAGREWMVSHGYRLLDS